MSERGPSNGSERRPTRWLREVGHWILFQGSRIALTGVVLLVVLLVLLTTTGAGYFAVGPRSTAATLFSSGLTSGVLTVVTLILSINQLILSRVFGSPEELQGRLQGTKEFRARIEQLAGVPSTPIDPATFIALIGETIRNRARGLSETMRSSSGDASAEIRDTLEEVADYGERIEESLDPGGSIAEVLDVLLATEYADKMTAVHEANNRHGDGLDEDQREELSAIEDLLEAIAIARQFFKTLALQQNFASLSRIIAITGLAAFFATISLSLLYQEGAVTLPPRTMPLVVSFGLTIVVAPVVAVIVYVLRAATVARHTVSVGPFVPPNE